MALTVGELRAYLTADDTGFRRGLRRAGDDLNTFTRDTDGRLRDIHGRFVSEGDRTGRGYSRGLSRAMRSGVSALGGMLSTVVGGLGKGAGGVMGLAFVGAFIAVGTSLLAGGAMIGLSYALLKDKPEVKKAAGDLKKTAVNIFKEAAEPMTQPIVTAFGRMKSLVQDLKPDIETLFQNTADSGALKSLTNGIEKFTKGVMPGLKKLTETMGPTFEGLETLMDRIGAGLGSFLGSMGEAAPQVKTLLGDIGMAIQAILWWAGKFFGFWAQAYVHVRGFIIKVINVFKWLYNVLVGNSIIPDLVNAVVTWFLSLPLRVLGGISSFVSAMIAKFKQMAVQLLARVSGAVSSIVGWFKQLPGMAFRALAPLAGLLAARAAAAGVRFYRSVVAKFSSAISWIRSIPRRITNAIGNLGGLLWNAGARLIAGFVNGIKSKIGAIQSTLSSVTSMLPDWKGPAKVDARILTPAGQSLIEGFQRGIASQIPGLRGQLRGITGDLPGMALPPPRGATSQQHAATGRVRVDINLSGGDSELVDWIRSRVQVDGRGDVQIAFGQR